MTGDMVGALMLRAVENPLGWKTVGALLYARLGGGGLWEERSRTKQGAQEPSAMGWYLVGSWGAPGRHHLIAHDPARWATSRNRSNA